MNNKLSNKKIEDDDIYKYLLMACQNKDIPLIGELLLLPTHPFTVNNILFYYCAIGDKKMIKYYMKRDKDKEINIQLAVCSAKLHGRISVIDMLLKMGAIIKKKECIHLNGSYKKKDKIQWREIINIRKKHNKNIEKEIAKNKRSIFINDLKMDVLKYALYHEAE